jgi:hypothetical protein
MYSSKQKMKKRPQKCLAALQAPHLIHLFNHWRMMLQMWYGMYKHWITPLQVWERIVICTFFHERNLMRKRKHLLLSWYRKGRFQP